MKMMIETGAEWIGGQARSTGCGDDTVATGDPKMNVFDLKWYKSV